MCFVVLKSSQKHGIQGPPNQMQGMQKRPPAKIITRLDVMAAVPTFF